MKLFNLRRRWRPSFILMWYPKRAIVNLVGLIQVLVGLLQRVFDLSPDVLDFGWGPAVLGANLFVVLVGCDVVVNHCDWFDCIDVWLEVWCKDYLLCLNAIDVLDLCLEIIAMVGQPIVLIYITILCTKARPVGWQVLHGATFRRPLCQLLTWFKALWHRFCDIFNALWHPLAPTNDEM